MKKLFAKITYLLIAIAVIGIVGVFLFRSKIFAADLGGGDQQTVDLGGSFGGKSIKVSISGNNGKIELEKNLFSSCKTNLSGFQNEAKISGTINLDNNEKAVEIVGLAGAHAENRQFFIADNNYCFKPLAFVKNGTMSYNIYSDEPNFLLQDFNADGISDIAAEYRNYDLNPILDGIRDIYLYNSSSRQFEFMRSENFQYQEIE